MGKDDEPGTPAPTPPTGEETPAWAKELTESNNRLAEKMGGVLDWITAPEDSPAPTPAAAPPSNLPQPDALDALGRRLQAVEALVLTPKPPTPAPPVEASPAPPSPPSPDAPGAPASPAPPASPPKTSGALGWLTRPL